MKILGTEVTTTYSQIKKLVSKKIRQNSDFLLYKNTEIIKINTSSNHKHINI